MKVSLLIPVYNAQSLIGKNIRKSYEALLSLNDDFEIIIVDDNSNDKSYRFKRLIDRARVVTGKDVKYLSYTKGPSRRENLGQAFFSVKHEIAGFIDADFSCDVGYLIEAVNILNKESADIVIGSRYIKGAETRREIGRRIISFLYNSTIRILFGSSVKDHQCGLKVFRMSSVKQILTDMGYDAKFIRGWFWDAELLIRAQRKRLKIIEFPVKWRCADSSTFSLKRELKSLIAIFGFWKTNH
jgi:glycosyltransferase involved in cell wall biosynthesis